MTVSPSYIDKDYLPAKRGYVGLEPPGDTGSWQKECKVLYLIVMFPDGFKYIFTIYTLGM